MISRFKTIDLFLIIIPIIFVVLSVAVIYSLVVGTDDFSYVVRQAVFAGIGIFFMGLGSFVDYRFFKGTSFIFYIMALLLLLLAYTVGKFGALGSKSWLDLGFFRLQPSEIAKIFLIFSLASFFSPRIGRLRWRDILFSLLMVGIPLGMILIEPDLGTALVIVFVYFFLFFVAKPNNFQKIIAILIIALASTTLVLAAAKVGPFGKILKDYQRDRLIIFINPASDPYDKGYNITQSQITVGSGGLFGKGLGKGSQSQLQFLPEPHTDFIFSGIAESFGFAGSITFLALYAYLILRILNIANTAKDNFGMLLSCGISAMFLFQVLINVGMTVGMAPITGIPLPLLSYGGTSMVVSLFSLGVAQSVYIRHQKIRF